MPNKEKAGKKLTVSVFVIFLLALCLVITTAALVYSMVSVDDNLFAAQTVQINTGTLIGTANLGIVYFDGSIDGTTPDTTTIQNYIGRFVPDTTGKLVINGSETTAKFSH